MAEFGIDAGRVRMTDPVPYEEMLRLVTRSHAVITDSGGLQEETTALGIPCLTVRPNTERPVTITEGTNRLVPDPAQLVSALAGVSRTGNPRRPEGWDGHAGVRIIAALKERLA